MFLFLNVFQIKALKTKKGEWKKALCKKTWMHISSNQIQNNLKWKPYSIRSDNISFFWSLILNRNVGMKFFKRYMSAPSNIQDTNFILYVVKSWWFHGEAVPHTEALNLLKADYKLATILSPWCPVVAEVILEILFYKKKVHNLHFRCLKLIFYSLPPQCRPL